MQKIFDLKKIELLSPAKNLEVGMAAVNHGADAVYIGGPGFGAREKASNSIEDIEKLCRHAAIFNAKVYVTLNTLLFDNELEQARKIAWDCYNAGVDALIVQDMALLMMDIPPIGLHASTQCHNITAEKVKFLEDIGFKQVVLARELSINEIKEIRSKTTVPLEFFVHGALCVSYSGQCYLSHVIGHRSANRGACAQPCRLKWNLEDENNNTLIANRHLLSLRDMNNSENIEELIDAGITSFKIEGRLKNADYVKNTTAYYRRVIDKVIERRPDLEPASRGVSTPSFEPNPEKSFSRGFTDYFAHGRQKNIDAPFTPKSMGEYIGEIRKIDGKRLTVKLKDGVVLHNGDGLCFLDESNGLQGFNVNGVEGGAILVSSALSPSRPKRIKERRREEDSSKLYRNFDILWQRSVDTSNGNRKIAVKLQAVDTLEGLRLSASVDDDIGASVEIKCQKDLAKNPEKAFESIRAKLSQWGDTKFTVESIDIDFKEVYFIPNSVLGDMKRQLIVKLEETLMEHHRVEPCRNASQQADFPTKTLSYSGNVVNSLSRKFYENHGVAHIDDGLEKTMPEGEIVLMTTKHCIRYANGMCAKETGKPATPLFISNEHGRFRLDFDCKKCCMKVVDI